MLPYTLDNFVGTLLHTEFPSTEIYKDTTDGFPIVKEWVDVVDTIDRYVSYKTTPAKLLLFIQGKSDHLSLYMESMENTCYVFDEDSSSGLMNVRKTRPSELPIDYLPKKNIYFNGEQTGHILSILQTFDMADKKT